MLKAGSLAKKKRREKQYLLQVTQQQLLQDRLVRDQLVKAATSKEREFVRLSGEVVAGDRTDSLLNRKNANIPLVLFGILYPWT